MMQQLDIKKFRSIEESKVETKLVEIDPEMTISEVQLVLAFGCYIHGFKLIDSNGMPAVNEYWGTNQMIKEETVS